MPEIIVDQPLVSCLCVTRGKPDKLVRAVRCFLAQRHPNRELIVVYEDDDVPTHSIVGELTRANSELIAVKVSATPKLTLGELRNVAVSHARGEYFCQWDDDDWYHDERISYQLDAALTNRREACLLTNWIIYDEIHRKAFFSHFRLWEGTVLCKRKIAASEIQYPAKTINEDNVFTTQLITRGYVYPLAMAGLYVYTVHGGNSWSREHFEQIFSRSQPLGPQVSSTIGEVLTGKYSIADASRILRSDEMLQHLNYFPEYARGK